MNKITAVDIVNLLISKKSEKFVCISECKTGKSWGNSYRIIDLWTMAKSWSNPLTVAYEIKINRHDFLKDNKWRDYLDYCNEFYFVAPKDIISPLEIPAEAGLITVSKNCRMYYTKKKAPTRTVSIPDDIYRYILMWRTTIQDERHTFNKKEFWQNWLEKRQTDKSLGREVSKKIRELYVENIERVEEENKELRRENETLQEIKAILKKIDFNPNTWNMEKKLREKIREFDTAISGDFLQALDDSIRNLQIIQAITGNGKNNPTA